MKQKLTPDRLYPAMIIVLLVLYTLYLWLYVNPSLYLIKGYREFFTDGYFFREYFAFPGRPAEYISRLLTQFNTYPLIAALLTFLCLTIIYFLGLKLFKGEKYSWWLAFVPVFVLIFMHNQYRHSIRFDLDILMLVSALFIFSISQKRSRELMYLSFPLLLATLFYLNGFFTAATFMITACLIPLKKEKNTYLLGFLASSFAVLILFYVIFSISVHDFRQELTDMSRIYPFRYFPLVLYLTIILLPLLAILFSSIKKKVPAKAVYASLLIAPATLLLLFLTLNKEEKKSLTVQHHARNGNWERVLQVAKGYRYPDRNVVFYTNLALWQTGKMQDELFNYNQSFGAEGLLLAEMSTFSEIVPNQEIFLQMGALSLSIIWGTEATNVYGANPYVLRNLVKAYLAGGYIKEAKKVLGQLDRSLFQKRWTAYYWEMANQPVLIDGDPELHRIRQSQTPLAVVSKQSPMKNLSLLAEENGLNRMAYDYLMVGTLLDHQMTNFAAYVPLLKEYGYDHIPKLYLEGLLYNTLYDPNLPMRVREYEYDQATLQNFSFFRTDLTRLHRDFERARKELKERYGDTYWYWVIFDSHLPDEVRIEAFRRMIT